MVYNTPHIIHLQETESTNMYLQKLTESDESTDETLAISDFQSSGRGQIGNKWESEAGKSLTFSMLYKPLRLPANQPFRIAQIAALSVKNTLNKYTSEITVKWPNDVYWKDKKICGILIENTLSEGRIARSIIGIGLNINQTVFRSDAPNPVSLTQITGKEYLLTDILDEWITSFQALRSDLENGNASKIHEQYCDSLYRRDGFHAYADTQSHFDARIHDIEPDGHLLLERRDGTLSRYAFKEVAFQ